MYPLQTAAEFLATALKEFSSPALSTGATLDGEGRVIVESDLSVPGHPNIFVIGDLANPNANGKNSLPGVAPVAMQEGRYVAQLIEQRLRGRTVPPFHYKDRGSLATIGRNAAVADIYGIHVSGFFAWFLWAAVHVFQLMEFENRFLVVMQWAWNYLTWNRTDLLITHAPPSRTPSKETLHAKTEKTIA